MREFFHNNRKLLILILFVSILLTSCSSLSNQTNTNDTNSDFVKHNYTQINMSDNTDYKSFSLINPYLKDKNVFLTGESHGIAINPELEVEFLKYFTAKADVKYYLQELSFSDAVFLNKYLKTGDEAILKKIYEPLKGTFAWNKQNYEKWKKVYDYNCSLPESEKLTIVGIDIEHQYQIAIWGMYSLIPNKEVPTIIKPIIDELKTLNSKIDSSSNEKSNVIAFSTKLKDSINQHRSDYEGYLDDSLFDFEIINDNIQYAKEAYAAQSSNDFQSFNNIRDKHMYENFIKIYAHLPGGKYYGQFGLNHIFQEAQQGTDWIASLMNKPISPVAKKILSIAYLYNDCKFMNRTKTGGYKVENITNYAARDGLLKPYSKYDLVLFRLIGKNSPFEKSLKWYSNDVIPTVGVTTDYYQFILLIRGSQATVPLNE